jgi:hypothetical protein
MSGILSAIKNILPAEHPAFPILENMPLYSARAPAAYVGLKLSTLWPMYIEAIREHNIKNATMLPVLSIENIFQSWDNEGFIYCILFAPGFVKIGMSAHKNKEKFMKSMYSRYKTAYGFTALNNENFLCKRVKNALDTEKKIHAHFKSNRLGKSEIFNFTPLYQHVGKGSEKPENNVLKTVSLIFSRYE